VAQPPLPDPSYDPVAQERAKRWSVFGRVALWGGLVVAAIALAIGAAASLLPRGRRLRWRPTRPTTPPPPLREVDEPEEAFFRVPTSLPRG
jgi:hypothetical protein